MPDETVMVGGGSDVADLVPGGEDEGEEAFESTEQERLVGVSGGNGGISRRSLHLVPHDGTATAPSFDPPVGGRRRRKPQLRLVK
jgi:hypothetical protein